jgi:hypothetical protein
MRNVVNDIAGSTDLSVTQLQDPRRIRVLLQQVAGQINDYRSSVSPPLRCANLDEQISDIIVETSAQGSSLLEVHIVDPAWTLLQRDKAGNCFIDVDSSGYLWPPIEINFPQGVSSAVWRLCQCRPTTDLSGSNLILTFEDRAASVMREYGGPVVSTPLETRAEFIRRLVKEVRIDGHLPPVSVNGVAYSPNTSAGPDGSIRFIPLLPHYVFTAADLAADEASLPASAKQPNKPRNVNKTPGPAQQKAALREVQTIINIETGAPPWAVPNDPLQIKPQNPDGLIPDNVNAPVQP